jgi:fluoride exporter
MLAVLMGGAVGTALRLGIDAIIPHGDTDFPASTLAINAFGAFVLALLVGRVWPTAPGWLRAGLGAGLLGSFTTFSALAVSLVSLTAAGFGMLALAAAALGLRLGSPRVTDVDLVDE